MAVAAGTRGGRVCKFTQVAVVGHQAVAGQEAVLQGQQGDAVAIVEGHGSLAQPAITIAPIVAPLQLLQKSSY